MVRKLEETLVRKLRERAAKAGISMEEEHRRILRAALGQGRRARDFKEHLLAIPKVLASFVAATAISPLPRY